METIPVEVALEKTEEETFATAKKVKEAKVEKSRPKPVIKKLPKIVPQIEQIVEGKQTYLMTLPCPNATINLIFIILVILDKQTKNSCAFYSIEKIRMNLKIFMLHYTFNVECNIIKFSIIFPRN